MEPWGWPLAAIAVAVIAYTIVRIVRTQKEVNEQNKK